MTVDPPRADVPRGLADLTPTIQAYLMAAHHLGAGGGPGQAERREAVPDEPGRGGNGSADDDADGQDGRGDEDAHDKPARPGPRSGRAAAPGDSRSGDA
jgi:hypothetical protein